MDNENTDENQPTTSNRNPTKSKVIDVDIKNENGDDKTLPHILSTDPVLSSDKSAFIKLHETVQNICPEKRNAFVGYGELKSKKPLFIEDSGPKMYPIKGNLVTQPLLSKSLPEQFNSLPIYGQPNHKKDLPAFFKNKVREFVGYDLSDEDFDKLSKYCSVDHLRTGVEVTMCSALPTYGPFPAVSKLSAKQAKNKAPDMTDQLKLCIHKKFRLRVEKDVKNHYLKKFKYRGVRMMPLTTDDMSTPAMTLERPLESGKELLFRVRIYRPYNHGSSHIRIKSGRHSVFVCDAVLPGRLSLQALRDRFVCANDASVRLDVAENPEDQPDAAPKSLFPSGFLFVNNVFYVDSRAGCVDHSAPVRAWAAGRGLGTFPVRDLAAARLDELVLKLGHPEVYVHQGNCEHLFTFSELRLLGPRDPPRLSQYPLHTARAHHQAVYCTTCAEFSAKWIVLGCQRVPFDPAFFCDTCFKLYLYKDGKKIGDFKAYAYKGNELIDVK